MFGCIADYLPIVPTSSRRCVQSGDQYTYSERWHQYDYRRHMQRHRSQGPDRYGVNAKEVLLHSTTGALKTSGMLPFKRCGLSASPATGLVGMQENVFLSGLFGCVGFFHSPSRVAPGGDLVKTSAGNQFPMDPSACTLWCAVALGALIKGRPIESVTSYAQLAKGALAKSSSGPGGAEVAKVWVILANLHGFMGDKGFAEIVKFKDIANVSCGKWQAEYLPVQGEFLPPPQLIEVATEAELYRYVSQSCVALAEAIYTTMIEQSASGGNGLYDSEPHGRAGGVHRSLEDLMAADFSKALTSLLDDGDVIDFGTLQEAVDRCHVTHTMLICLAAAGDSSDRAVYDRFRVISNPFRLPDSQPPPFVEWCVVGAFCDEIFHRYDELLQDQSPMQIMRCAGTKPEKYQVFISQSLYVSTFSGTCHVLRRSIEVLVPCGRMRPFLEPPVDDIDADLGTMATGSGIDKDAPHGHGHTQREILTAFNRITGNIAGTAPV
ncbi:unnamed protein product [Ectocarpus sp. CCAP 1310/34]|nr:unnamed protein product [Ectocarpus sp. CCAP 1310/34]